MPAVSWRWWLVRSSDMTQIAELKAHDRQLQIQLNSQGKATCWIDLLDDVSSSVVEHQTALRLDRNNQTVWSGPILQANEDSQGGTGTQQGSDKLSITAMGWFQTFNQRMLHTGADFSSMLTAPNGVAWQATYGAYTQIGIDTATQLAYSATQFPNTTDASIFFDLVNRANIDSPTLVTTGHIYGSPVQRNLTMQRFQNVGQEITTLCNVESGVDFDIDPTTRQMNLYGVGASGSPSILNGRGVDRGNGVLFSYPGNCVKASRSGDGTKTANRVISVGQYGVGRADDYTSQQQNGLFEAQVSSPEVVDQNILIAYANAEVVVLRKPWKIIQFTPRAVMASDANTPGVPRPFQDYDLGDLVYCRINRGPRFQVGSSTAPQQTRVFGFTVDIDDTGIERVSQIQTTYQGLGG